MHHIYNHSPLYPVVSFMEDSFMIKMSLASERSKMPPSLLNIFRSEILITISSNIYGPREAIYLCSVYKCWKSQQEILIILHPIHKGHAEKYPELLDAVNSLTSQKVILRTTIYCLPQWVKNVIYSSKSLIRFGTRNLKNFQVEQFSLTLSKVDNWIAYPNFVPFLSALIAPIPSCIRNWYL